MSSSSQAPTIVFDLDGTLVDSAPDLLDALNVVIGRDGVPPLSLEAGRPFVGRGGRALIRRALEAAGRTVSDNGLETMFAAFLARYEDHLADRTLFFPGAEATLDRLAADGYRLAVLTNKFERTAKKLVTALGAAGRFAVIVGQDTFPVSKPNGAALRLTVETAGGDPVHAIMVGDTATDIATARNAGLPVIAVDFGYSQEPIRTLAPDRVVSRFDDLRGAIEILSNIRRDAATSGLHQGHSCC